MKTTHTEPEHVRRKLAKSYRAEAGNPRRTKSERATFEVMAESWERTLPKQQKK